MVLGDIKNYEIKVVDGDNTTIYEGNSNNISTELKSIPTKNIVNLTASLMTILI